MTVSKCDPEVDAKLECDVALFKGDEQWLRVADGHPEQTGEQL